MKRFLFPLTAALVWGSVLVLPGNLSRAAEEGTTAAQAGLVELTDASGAVLRLREYSLWVEEAGPMHKSLYGRSLLVPLHRGAGVVEFFGIEAVKEYQFDGSAAHVFLTNGETATGTPCPDCRVHGKGVLGSVEVNFVNVRALRFDVPLAATAGKAELARSTPFRENERTGTIRTSGGESYVLSSINFIEEGSYCDPKYMGCVRVYKWDYSKTLRLRYGLTTNAVPLETLKSLESIPPPPPPKEGRGQRGSLLPVRVSMATGESMNVILDTDETEVYLIGVTPTGSVLTPVYVIRSIQIGLGR